MPSRDRRRRRRRDAADDAERAPTAPSMLRRSEVIAAAGLGVAVLLILTGVLLFGGGGGSSSPAPTGAPSGSAASAAVAVTATPVFSPSTAAELAIEALARRTIEALPQGQWPALYDSFTAQFQQRCSRDQFVAAGVEGARQQGSNLPSLRFQRLQSASVQGQSATAVVVGEVAGGVEYSIQESFALENGVWKIAAAPNTQGCEAFGRLSG